MWVVRRGVRAELVGDGKASGVLRLYFISIRAAVVCCSCWPDKCILVIQVSS